MSGPARRNTRTRSAGALCTTEVRTMQDAAVERLAKIIAPEDDPGKNRRLQARNLLAHLRLAEGWFSFFLLALVVYSTIWCVQAVNWVDHLSLLTPITALGCSAGLSPPSNGGFLACWCMSWRSC